MPVKKVKGGYRFGTKGKVYKSKGKAKKQARAIYASGYCNVTAAIDGVQFTMSSGNIAAGTIKMYGVV